jgi:hypothetical protein
MKPIIWACKLWPVWSSIYILTMIGSGMISLVTHEYHDILVLVWLCLVQYRTIVVLHKSELNNLYLKLKL